MPAPENLIIDTPEQIALEFPLASAGSRFLALAIDTLIEAVAFLTLFALGWVALWLGMTVSGTVALWGGAILLFAAFTIYYGYFAFFEALWAGQTPGKRAIGIRVISATGRPISAFDAILRNLLRIVDQLPFIYVVGLVSVFFSSRNQRLGDLAAGTVVVHERAVERPRGSQVPAATSYGAARLDPSEIGLIEAFLERREGLDSYFRLTTARRILDRLRPRLDLPPQNHASEERILEELLGEYRSRPPR